MLEPTAPASKDSTAPSAVMVRVGARSSEKFSQGILGRWRRCSRNNVWGMAPIIGTDQFKIQLSSVARMIPSSEDGKRVFHVVGQKSIVPITTSAMVIVCQSGI